MVTTFIVTIALAATACGPQAPDASDLSNLQLTGVDFELNSIVIENTGSEPVRTENLWIYRDGDAYQLGIFTVEPRASVLFSMRVLGDISVLGGEIALNEAGVLDDAESMLAYVAWGTDGFELAPVATEAGLWPPDETVSTETDTVVLFRIDPTGSGPVNWEISDVAG